MINLDDDTIINKYDLSRLYDSIIKLPDQVEQAWSEIKNTAVPESCPLVKNVVVSGMGGSALGGRVVDSLIEDRVRVPIEISTKPKLPHYVDQNTLVIISSYSGNTEESVESLRQAIDLKAKIFVITCGGQMLKIIKDRSLAAYIINPLNNPSKQPRMGLGYSILAVLGILNKCEFVQLSDNEVVSIVRLMREIIPFYSQTSLVQNNPAKSLALKLLKKIPVLIASEHLVGIIHGFKNQLNENAKTFANLFDIPELNHHLLEGLRYPVIAKSLYTFVFLKSDLYSAYTQASFKLTQEIVQKNSIDCLTHKYCSSNKINQIFESLVFGSFVSFYLAMLNEIDPTPIPWVDYFKANIQRQ